ncbi:uncharacterized protein LOC114541668 [Dendronephthya gigantea]|uniref:uncharacterized protein LOC114541668 n=1 Tax=Dendronephthya gigantea TaxID=151771 RepID=UPI00106B6EC4|nr:uncharacterized protein LOC114541668 [Dendronephthya gigantea]
MNHSVIHAVQKSGQISVDATYNANDGLTKVKLTQDDEDEDGESEQSGKQSFFFVYCKTCKKLTRGKLRCRCSNCKEGSFVLSQEFYFKCGEHHGRDEQALLSMLKSNIRNIPCITCSKIS